MKCYHVPAVTLAAKPAMNWLIAIPLALGIFVGLANVAHADYDDDWKACKGSEPQYSLDQVIAGCASVISSGRVSRSRLATAYNNRGAAYNGKEDLWSRDPGFRRSDQA